MATAASKTRTLEVICPKCFDADAAVTLDLNDLDLCTCTGCDETFSADEAARTFSRMAEKWAAVARWIDSAPTT